MTHWFNGDESEGGAKACNLVVQPPTRARRAPSPHQDTGLADFRKTHDITCLPFTHNTINTITGVSHKCSLSPALRNQLFPNCMWVGNLNSNHHVPQFFNTPKYVQISHNIRWYFLVRHSPHISIPGGLFLAPVISHHSVIPHAAQRQKTYCSR